MEKKLANTSTKKSDTAEIDPSFMPVVAVFADDPVVRRGKMFSSSSVLTVNGKVFAMLVKGRFVAKLPRERIDESRERRQRRILRSWPRQVDERMGNRRSRKGRVGSSRQRGL
jgi:hypothetical protein